jgi:hypothetical protein
VKFKDAMNKGLTIRTNQCPVKRQWPRLFEHVRNGYLKPSEIVTHRFPLEGIAEATTRWRPSSTGSSSRSSFPPPHERGTSHGRHHRADIAGDRRRRPTQPNADAAEQTLPRAYLPDKEPAGSSSEALRNRIPGWGVDLDSSDRPSVPRAARRGGDRRALGVSGATARDVPARALDRARRASAGLRHRGSSEGRSGLMRRFAYRRYSEARRSLADPPRRRPGRRHGRASPVALDAAPRQPDHRDGRQGGVLSAPRRVAGANAGERIASINRSTR